MRRRYDKSSTTQLKGSSMPPAVGPDDVDDEDDAESCAAPIDRSGKHVKSKAVAHMANVIGKVVPSRQNSPECAALPGPSATLESCIRQFQPVAPAGTSTPRRTSC